MVSPIVSTLFRFVFGPDNQDYLRGLPSASTILTHVHGVWKEACKELVCRGACAGVPDSILKYVLAFGRWSVHIARPLVARAVAAYALRKPQQSLKVPEGF